MIRHPFNVKSGALACPACGNTTEFVANSRQVAEDCCDIWISCDNCKLEPTSEYKREDVWGIIDRNSIAVLLTDWNQWVTSYRETTMIERDMTLQVPMKVVFKDDEAEVPPCVRIYDELGTFRWRITAEGRNSNLIPDVVLFHAKQFLYDNHPELGPQPTE